MKNILRAVAVLTVLAGQVWAADKMVCEQSTQWLMRHSDEVFVGVVSDILLAGEFHETAIFAPSKIWQGGTTRGNYIRVLAEKGQFSKGREYLVFTSTKGCAMYLYSNVPEGKRRIKQLEKKYDIIWQELKKPKLKK